MRDLLLFLVALPLWAATPPTVSNITFAYIGHSSTSVFFDSNESWNRVQLLYALLPNSCTSGGTTGGGNTGVFESNGTPISGSAGYTSLILTGLTPGASYQVCPEVSNDGGVNWSSGVGATLQLQAASETLRRPLAPATVDTSYPDLSKGTCWINGQPGACSMVVNTPCEIGSTGSASGPGGTVNNDIAMAIRNQAASSTTVLIPAAQVCSDAMLKWNVTEPDVISFDPGQVQNYSIIMSKALSSYTAAGPNGITEGLGLRFEQNGYNPTIPMLYNLNDSLGTLPDYIYFVHVTGTNSFELYWPWTRITNVAVTSGSHTLHVGSLLGDGGATSGVVTGAEVAGPGIPDGTTVTAISGDPGAYTITLSASATASATEALTFGGGDETAMGVSNNMPLQIIFGNTWVVAANYATGEKVSYYGQVWQALQDVPNNGPAPATGSAYWSLSTGPLPPLPQTR